MPRLMAITIPKWGIEMERGTISEWRVAPGAEIAKGDELVDIETDKIVNSFEASDDGILVRIIAEEGEELEVGSLIGVMASEPVSDEEVDAFIAANLAGGQAGAESGSQSASTAAAPASGTDKSSAIRISPALRRKAERLGLDIATIPGTGYGGRILRDDIEAMRAQGTGAPVANLRQLQGAQKTIAERMTLAKQSIPHFYLQRDCVMDSALSALETARAESGAAITVNHILIQAVSRALQKHPEVNLNLLPNGIRDLAAADVAVAVDTGDSLLTPVVKDITDASLATVAEAARQVVERARNRQLSSDDLDGSAITVSNLGMFGVSSFTAIINPPQVMILAVGTIQERVVLRDGKPAGEHFCSLSLACDHRVINGATGARFLTSICEAIEAGLA